MAMPRESTLDAKLVNACVKVKVSLDRHKKKAKELEADMWRMRQRMTAEEHNEYFKRVSTGC